MSLEPSPARAIAEHRPDRLFAVIGRFLACRVWLPEWLFNWAMRREVERKGYHW